MSMSLAYRLAMSACTSDHSPPLGHLSKGYCGSSSCLRGFRTVRNVEGGYNYVASSHCMIEAGSHVLYQVRSCLRLSDRIAWNRSPPAINSVTCKQHQKQKSSDRAAAQAWHLQQAGSQLPAMSLPSALNLQRVLMLPSDKAIYTKQALLQCISRNWTDLRAHKSAKSCPAVLAAPDLRAPTPFGA